MPLGDVSRELCPARGEGAKGRPLPTSVLVVGSVEFARLRELPEPLGAAVAADVGALLLEPAVEIESCC